MSAHRGRVDDHPAAATEDTTEVGVNDVLGVCVHAANGLWLPAAVWNPTPQLPSDVLPALNQMFAWGRGVITVIGVIGVLYCAGKMVAAKGGRADLGAEGVSGLLWTMMGICLMLVAASIVSMLISPPAEDDGGFQVIPVAVSGPVVP